MKFWIENMQRMLGISKGFAESPNDHDESPHIDTHSNYTDYTNNLKEIQIAMLEAECIKAEALMEKKTLLHLLKLN